MEKEPKYSRAPVSKDNLLNVWWLFISGIVIMSKQWVNYSYFFWNADKHWSIQKPLFPKLFTRSALPTCILTKQFISKTHSNHQNQTMLLLITHLHKKKKKRKSFSNSSENSILACGVGEKRWILENVFIECLFCVWKPSKMNALTQKWKIKRLTVRDTDFVWLTVCRVLTKWLQFWPIRVSNR